MTRSPTPGPRKAFSENTLTRCAFFFPMGAPPVTIETANAEADQQFAARAWWDGATSTISRLRKPSGQRPGNHVASHQEPALIAIRARAKRPVPHPPSAPVSEDCRFDSDGIGRVSAASFEQAEAVLRSNGHRSAAASGCMSTCDNLQGIACIACLRCHHHALCGRGITPKPAKSIGSAMTAKVEFRPVHA